MQNEEIHILLVDDEDDVLEFLSYNIRKEGYVVHTANNGIKGLQKAIETVPHLIILDVMMPEMDGIETCREIKQIPQLKNSIIVFLTARGEDYSQIAGFDAGADDYITKPINSELLIALINKYFQKIKL